MLRFDLSIKSLAANQYAIQTTSHNIANANTPGYTRQETSFVADSPRNRPNIGYLGQGLGDIAVDRKADHFLDGRIETNNQSVGQLSMEQRFLEDIESVLTPGEGDLISQMDKFVEDLYNLSEYPEDMGLRSIFSNSVSDVGRSFREMYAEFEQIMDNIQVQIDERVSQVNIAVDKIADLNKKLIGRVPPSSDLLDQRGELLKELHSLVPARTLYTENGSAQVVVGNRLLVDKASANHLETDTTGGTTAVLFEGTTIAFAPEEGELGGLLNVQNTILPNYQDKLDSLAEEFASEVNKIHSTGIPKDGGFTSLISEEAESNPADSLAAQGFNIINGDLTIGVRDLSTDTVTQATINIDPSDTFSDVASKIDGIANMNASVNADGKLFVTSDLNYEFVFESDNSNVLSQVGLNTLFKGRNAKDIDISDHIAADPARLAFAKSFAPGNNENVLNIIDTVQNAANANLDGQTFRGFMGSTISEVGNSTKTTRSNLSLQNQLVDDLKNRRESISGVSIDEELIKLNQFQNAFQAGARLFQVVDELMETVVNLG